MTGINTPVVTSVCAVIVAVITAIGVWRNATKANRAPDSLANLAWVQQAQAEAREAKSDAKEAKASAAQAETSAIAASRHADAATDRADKAERRLAEGVIVMDGLVRWAEVVIGAAQNPATGDDEVRRLVNGGPPGFTQARLAMDRRRTA